MSSSGEVFDAPLWEVVGGGDKGGIVVRQGVSLSSALVEERLSTGSLVQQLALEDDRLQFKKLSGSGPDLGWVSLRIKGKDLVVPAAPPRPDKTAVASTNGFSASQQKAEASIPSFKPAVSRLLTAASDTASADERFAKARANAEQRRQAMEGAARAREGADKVARGASYDLAKMKEQKEFRSVPAPERAKMKLPSAEAADEATRSSEPSDEGVELFKGQGQELGGTTATRSADPRAAALAAAEKRAQQQYSHGVSDKKAQQLKDRERCEALLVKIREMYAKKHEEPPAMIASGTSVATLQKHLDSLQVEVAAAAATPTRPSSWEVPFNRSQGETPSDVKKPQAQQFSPPPRITDDRLLQPAQTQPVLPQSPEERRLFCIQQATTQYGLNQEQLRSVLDLEELGFDYGRALEAYLACERNQELAANYLFESQFAEPEPAAELPQVQQPAQPLPWPSAPENVSLSRQEWESVQRLELLGFERNAALSVFVHFRKDEEAAGNELLM